jgi:uncharacterized protein
VAERVDQRAPRPGAGAGRPGAADRHLRVRAYGGYFGAAQGVLVIGLLGTFLDETLQRVNGAKNVLVTIVNGAAAAVFLAFAHVSWGAAALVAAGSAVGGLLGARFGRRLHPAALRLFVVMIGLISAIKLLFF